MKSFNLPYNTLNTLGFTNLTAGNMHFQILDDSYNVLMQDKANYTYTISGQVTTYDQQLVGTDVTIPAHFTYDPGNGIGNHTFTITGFDKGKNTTTVNTTDENNALSVGSGGGFSRSSIQIFRLPSTLNTILVKDCFRNNSGTASLKAVFFDPNSNVTGSSRDEPAGQGGDCFYYQTNLKLIDFPPTFEY
jgi:hypothetical protein